MNIFVNLKDIIIICLIIFVSFCTILFNLIKEICNIGKKNCYKCKYYKLYDVASCGDCCWYECIKHNRKDNGVSMNEKEKLVRCKDFKELKGSDKE